MEGMNKLADLDADTLRTALDATASPTAVKRLMIALTYADGGRVEPLSERYDIPHASMYLWLDRFEHYSISEVIEDEPRPELRRN